MSKWILIDEDGALAAQLILAPRETPGEGDNPHGLRSYRVKRFARAGEQYDPQAKRWKMVDVERAADALDAAHRADYGPGAIDAARQFKALEARIMLAGVALDGMVAAEAIATGQDPMALARSIARAAAQNDKAEIARIIAKRKARGVKTGST